MRTIGFDASDPVQDAFVRHPATSMKEFFVALAIGQGLSRSRGKKEFEKRRDCCQRGQSYSMANFVRRGVEDILAGRTGGYGEFRVKERSRRPEPEDLRAIAA